jgi:hypothetical protein
MCRAAPPVWRPEMTSGSIFNGLDTDGCSDWDPYPLYPIQPISRLPAPIGLNTSLHARLRF